jgi:hypothetical protein
MSIVRDDERPGSPLCVAEMCVQSMHDGDFSDVGAAILATFNS